MPEHENFTNVLNFIATSIQKPVTIRKVIGAYIITTTLALYHFCAILHTFITSDIHTGGRNSCVLIDKLFILVYHYKLTTYKNSEVVGFERV